MKSRIGKAAIAASLTVLGGASHALPAFADIVAIVDESGSMSGEHAWLGGMAVSLNAGLVAANLTPNNFGLTGYGNGLGAQNSGRQISVGGGAFGSAAQFSAATASLVLSGGTEDGYAGINFANSNYSYRPATARNYILVTDEDRDNTNSALTFASILAGLQNTGTLLNAVVNATFRCGTLTTGILGIDSSGRGYVANGSGGYTSASGCTAVSGAGTTVADYVNLALASGGAAWDLNLLRAGGATAASFTAAFVDIKVQEIVNTPVPIPGTLALVGLGLAGLFTTRRRRAAA